MHTEYEVKFLDVDIENVRHRLTKLGAKLEKPMRLMKRVTIDNLDMKKKNAFVRIRDEGDRVIVTYKQFDSLSVDGAKEYEIVVSDFEKAIKLFSAAGLPYGSFQESKRETWKFNDVEIVIDEWPWLNPYIEIESDSEVKVKNFAKKLGFDWKDAAFGDVMTAYRAQYPHLTDDDRIGDLPYVKFEDPLPDLFKKVAKS